MTKRRQPPDPDTLSSPELLQRIATEVGVSIRTVYRVLNQRSEEIWHSAADRSERIRALAQEWGYRPNLAARTTRTGRFGAVSLVMGMGPHSSSFPLNFIKGLHDGLASAGFHLLVSRVDDEQLADVATLPSYLRSQQVDGLVMYYDQQLPAHAEAALTASRLPHLWVNVKRAQNCIHYDDHGAARLAVETLVQMGHVRIAYVSRGGSGQHYSTADRLQGYYDGMRAAGLDPLVLEPLAGLTADETHPQHFNLAERLTTFFAAQAQWPTAVIGYSANDLVAVYIAAARLGLQVPCDLSLIGIHQQQQPPAGLPLSAVVSESYDVGLAAGQLAVDIVNDPKRVHAPFPQPYVFLARGTHGPPPL